MADLASEYWNNFMSKLDFFTLFRQAASEVSGNGFDSLDKATTLSDIGLDSVAAMEFVGYLEERLEVRLPDEELANIDTLGDLEVLLQQCIARKGAA